LSVAPASQIQAWLKSLGYELMARTQGFSECLVSRGDERWLGRGLSEEEAKKAGYDVIVGMFPMAALGRAATMNSTDGLVKLVADKKTEVILGVGITASNACDLIAEACLAIEMGALVDDMGLTVHAHPTFAESLMEAAKAAKGEAVHIVNKNRARH
jgi:dihydrolipoamide dehydrogenase